MAKKYNRKIVETAYSIITLRFPKRIHAVIVEGFQLKVFFVILAYAIIGSVLKCMMNFEKRGNEL